jgi:hypothetical protein
VFVLCAEISGIKTEAQKKTEGAAGPKVHPIQSKIQAQAPETIIPEDEAKKLEVSR